MNPREQWLAYFAKCLELGAVEQLSAQQTMQVQFLVFKHFLLQRAQVAGHLSQEQCNQLLQRKVSLFKAGQSELSFYCLNNNLIPHQLYQETIEQLYLKKIFIAQDNLFIKTISSTVKFATKQENSNSLAQLKASITADAPEKLGNYQIQEELGAGGMGKVYKAYQPQLDRTVAIKVMLHSVNISSSQKERFLTEAKVMAKLKHPNIVAVHDIGLEDEMQYIVMDFIKGKPLPDMWSLPLSLNKALNVVKKIALAMEYAHQNGVIHRDLKPGNLLIEENSEKVLVMDFGLAKNILADKKITKSGEIMGTPQYMAPEQVEGKVTSAKTDIYALGTILYELLCGKCAVSGENSVNIMFNVVNSQVIPIHRRNRDIPIPVANICHKAMAKRPQDRYSSAKAMASDIERFFQGKPILAKEIKSKKSRKFTFAIVVSVVFLCVVGFFLQKTPQKNNFPKSIKENSKEKKAKRFFADAQKLMLEISQKPSSPYSQKAKKGKIETLQKKLSLLRKYSAELTKVIKLQPENLIADQKLQQAHMEINLLEGHLLVVLGLGQKEKSVQIKELIKAEEKLLEKGTPKNFAHMWCLAYHVYLSLEVFIEKEIAVIEKTLKQKNIPGQKRRSLFELWREKNEERELYLTKNAGLLEKLVDKTSNIQTRVSIYRRLGSQYIRIAKFFTRFTQAMGKKFDAKTVEQYYFKVTRHYNKSVELAQKHNLKGNASVFYNHAFAKDNYASAILAVEPEKAKGYWRDTMNLILNACLSAVTEDDFSYASSYVKFTKFFSRKILRSYPNPPTQFKKILLETMSLSTATLKQSTGKIKTWLKAIEQLEHQKQPLIKKTLFNELEQGKITKLKILTLDKTPVLSLSFSPDGKHLAASDSNKKIKIWSLKDYGMYVQLQNNSIGNYSSICFSPNGKLLACGGSQTMTFYEWKEKKRIALSGEQKELFFAEFDPKGRYFMSSFDNKFRLRRVKDGKTILNFSGHKSTIINVSSHSKGIAIGGKGKGISILQPASKSYITIATKENIIHQLSFSPDGKYILAASGKKNPLLEMWTVSQPATLKFSHKIFVFSQAFAPNGKILATGGDRAKINLWKMPAGKKLFPVSFGKTRAVTAVAFSPDGKILAAGREDGLIVLLRCSFGF